MCRGIAAAAAPFMDAAMFFVAARVKVGDRKQRRWLPATQILRSLLDRFYSHINTP
jgi:hypothetical protein